MKHLYTLIFLLIANFCLAQQVREKGDIEDFKLYPNPATQGKVNIVTGQSGPKTVRIYDVLGTPVLETTLFGNELNLSGLDAGVYLIQVFQQDKVATRKLIVK